MISQSILSDAWFSAYKVSTLYVSDNMVGGNIVTSRISGLLPPTEPTDATNKEYVDMITIPQGGNTYQILTKSSDVNYATEWTTFDLAPIVGIPFALAYFNTSGNFSNIFGISSSSPNNLTALGSLESSIFTDGTWSLGGLGSFSDCTIMNGHVSANYLSTQGSGELIQIVGSQPLVNKTLISISNSQVQWKSFTSIGGSNTQVQYNLNDSFAGSAYFTFNQPLQTLNVTNLAITLITSNSINSPSISSNSIDGTNISATTTFTGSTFSDNAGSSISGSTVTGVTVTDGDGSAMSSGVVNSPLVAGIMISGTLISGTQVIDTSGDSMTTGTITGSTLTDGQGSTISNGVTTSSTLTDDFGTVINSGSVIAQSITDGQGSIINNGILTSPSISDGAGTAVGSGVITTTSLTGIENLEIGTLHWDQGPKTVGPFAGNYFGFSVAMGSDYSVVGNNGFNGTISILDHSGSVIGSPLRPNADNPQIFGYSVSISGNYVIAGSPFPTGDSSTNGAWIYQQNSPNWTLVGGKLVQVDAVGILNQIGYSVSIFDSWAAVGSPTDGTTDGITNIIGAVWIYKQNLPSWTQFGYKLVPSNAIGFSKFGFSISLFHTTIIIGGPTDNSNIGAAWIFKLTRNGWTQLTKLIPTGYIGTPFFGSAVALYNNVAVIGGPYDNTNVGAIWIFTFSGSSWTQTRKIVQSGALMYFGGTVSIYNTIICAASYDVFTCYNNQGSIFGAGSNTVWTYNNTGAGWVHNSSSLTPSNPTGAVDIFSISLYNNSIIFGSCQDDATYGATWIFYDMPIYLQVSDGNVVVPDTLTANTISDNAGTTITGGTITSDTIDTNSFNWDNIQSNVLNTTPSTIGFFTSNPVTQQTAVDLPSVIALLKAYGLST